MSQIFFSPLPSPYPLENIKKLDKFGMRDLEKNGNWKMHNGVDLRPKEDEVLAIFDGVCTFSGFDKYGGQYIDVASNDGNWKIRAVHTKLNYLKPGQKVSAGQKFALVGGAKGQTGAGLSTGRHLHFELHQKQNGRFVPVNPETFINFNFTFSMYQELIKLRNDAKNATQELGKKTDENNQLKNEIAQRTDNQRILNEIIDDLRLKNKELQDKIWQIQDKLDKFISQDARLRELINEIGETLGLKICEGQNHGDFTKKIIEKLKTLSNDPK